MEVSNEVMFFQVIVLACQFGACWYVWSKNKEAERRFREQQQMAAREKALAGDDSYLHAVGDSHFMPNEEMLLSPSSENTKRWNQAYVGDYSDDD
jgi:hypothetical protein